MKKNVASQKIGAQLITAADGSAFTGSVTVSVTGDAGTQATGSVGSGACTHEGNGYHTYAPAQAETNYDLVAFTFTGTGAIPVTVQVFTLPTTGILAPATLGRTLVVDASGLADANTVKVGPTGSGTAQTARDIGASVLLSSGTGTGQLDFTSGRVKADTVYFGGSAGSFTTGVPAVNMTLIAGSLVSTSTAQIGVNVVNAGGTAWGSGAITAASIAADAIGASELAADAVTEIAAAIWQDTTAGHFTTAGSIGKSLFTSGVVPGASGGLFLAGSNAATTVASWTCTAAMTVSGGLALSNTGSGKVFSMIGAGSGDVMYLESNSGAPLTFVTGGGLSPGIQFNIDSGVDVVFSGTVTATNASNHIRGCDVGWIDNDAQSLADLKDFADAGYDPSVNKVNGVVLVDTTTTVTDQLASTAIADAILSRNVSNVEGSAGEHTLCTVVLAMLENSISGTTLTIKRTDGSTTHYTKTLSVDAAADPITGIQ